MSDHCGDEPNTPTPGTRLKRWEVAVLIVLQIGALGGFVYAFLSFVIFIAVPFAPLWVSDAYLQMPLLIKGGIIVALVISVIGAFRHPPR